MKLHCLRAGLHGTALATALVLGACTLGPDFHAPAAPASGYTKSGSETKPGANLSLVPQLKLDYGARVAADWYHLLGSKALDRLIRQALSANPTLIAARARVRQAQARLRAANGGRLPTLQGRAVANRAHLNPKALGIPAASRGTDNNIFVGVLQLSYNLDIFGELRRKIEAQGARTTKVRAQAIDAYTELVNHVVATALEAATAQSLINATQKLVQAQQKQLQLIQMQERIGTTARATTLTAQAQVEATLANLPELRQRRDAAWAALAPLLGMTPAQFTPPQLSLANLVLPDKLPVSLPSQLVTQRPDILEAQALLHEASAEVGVAIAARLPAFSLSANYGSLSDRGADFFNASNALWALGGNITAPLFAGGRLAANEDAAKAGLQAAQAQYRATVLQAFSQVATALRALDNDSAALKAHDRALHTAQQALQLSDLQFHTGTVAELQVLQAQQEYRSQLLSQVTAQARQLADVATLMHALGGGWWNAPKAVFAPQTSDAQPEQSQS